MREAILWEAADDGAVVCNVCQIRCRVPRGEAGVCRVRVNEDGRLGTLIYGLTSSLVVDPIEKKPVFHYRPGSKVLSSGTRGCNFACPGCQNGAIAHDRPVLGENLEPMTPERQVELAVEHGADGLAWTYNEPVIWIEHNLEAARIAKERGLYTAYITNGYATPEALDLIAPVLDVYRCDIKGFSKQAYERVSGGFGHFEGILELLARARHHHGLHVECVTNVVPGVNDDLGELRAAARWIARELGPLTPWHLTRFFPYLDLGHLRPTPIDTLDRVHAIAREEGLRHVYVGNVPGHAAAHTYCHGCGEMLLHRSIYAVTPKALGPDGRCEGCGETLPGTFDSAPPAPSTGDRARVRPS